jgi:hypothetical protein
MAAKVFLAIAAQTKPDNTFIDVGSSFDGLVNPSRDYHEIPNYKQLLSQQYE